MFNMSFSRVAAMAAVALTLAATSAFGQTPESIVAAADRSDADRQSDVTRDPIGLLRFIGAMPGWHVLDMAAGAGYGTELIARAVGPEGKVFAQDFRASAKLAARMKTPALANAVSLVTAFDDLSDPALKNLDLETFMFGYHDTTFLRVDRAKMNSALFAALKPGGLLVVADHAAKPEDGVSVGKTLHRVAEKDVRSEIEAAGFVFVAAGDFLRRPEDPRSDPIFKNPTPVDGFILKFKKP